MDIRAAEISAILKEQIKNFGTEAEVTEVGQVLSVGDGIALRGLEQYLHMFRGQRSYLFPPYLRRLDGLSGVARDKAVSDGLLERLVKSDVDILDGTGRESSIKLLPVEYSYVGRRQVFQLQLTQYRAYVEANHLLISLKGCGTYGVMH